MKLGKVVAFILFLNWLVLSWMLVLGLPESLSLPMAIIFWLVFAGSSYVIAYSSDSKK